MASHRPTALAPNYLHRFQCLGTTCEETCCNGWQIDLDKAAFQRYKSIPVKALADKAAACVTKLPSPTTGRYARITLDAQGNCPMLDERRLCSLHAELGVEFLSHLCRDFPRSYARTGNRFTAYASMGCPETVRLALLAPDAMDLVPMPLPFPNDGAVPVARVKPAPSANDDPIQTHGELITSALKTIITLPFLDATNAVLIGGMLVRLAARAAAADGALEARRNAVAATVAGFLDVQTLIDARQKNEALDTPRAPQISLLLEIAALYVRLAEPTSFSEVLRDVLDGLKADGDEPDAIVARFIHAQETWFSPYEQARPWALKNYVLNHLGKSLFPATGAQGIEDEYISLCVRFAFLRFCLIGYTARHGKPLTDDQLVKVTYTFGRRIEHDAAFLPEIEAAIRKAGFSTLGMMATLLR